mmetsp:Transcript_28592/g.44794  ORF Transcript_28592/g.44794 Transcript_28592/m.44794 type:complete len:170 (+) Transcript_28592:2-511(+)
MSDHSRILRESGAAVQLERNGSHFCPKWSFGAILIGPCCSPLPRRKNCVLDAIKRLKSLSNCGIHHGDARYPNVIWNMETDHALWIDFGRMRIMDNSEKVESFSQDLQTLAHSFGLEFDHVILSKLADAYFIQAKDEVSHELQQILEIFQPVWSGGQQSSESGLSSHSV